MREGLNWRPVVAVLTVVAIVAAVIAGRALLSDGPSAERSMAPEFRLQTPGGSALGLNELRGRWVILNFWASWCGPCKDETPLLEAFYHANRDLNVEIVGVDEGEQVDDVRRFADGYGLTYSLVLDKDNALAGPYRLPGLPVSVLVDPTGRIADSAIGPLTEARLAHWRDAFIRP